MLYAQRGEDVLVDIVGISLSADPLHNIAGQRRAPVGVGCHRAGGIDLLRLVESQGGGQIGNLAALGEKQVGQHLLKPGVVVHQVEHGHRLVEAEVGEKTLRQIGANIRV